MKKIITLFVLSLLAMLSSCSSTSIAVSEGPAPRGPETGGQATDTPKAYSTDRPGEQVTFDRVYLLVLENGDGEQVPQIRDQITNNTGKTITAYRIGMAAYDGNGRPLELLWDGFDDDGEISHIFLSGWIEETIQPGAHQESEGGWTLFSTEEWAKEAYDQIAYILYTFQQVSFEDGTVWINPDYEDWEADYEDEAVEVGLLKTYYPHAVYIED